MIYLQALWILSQFAFGVGLMFLWAYICIYKFNSVVLYGLPFVIGFYFLILGVLKDSHGVLK